MNLAHPVKLALSFGLLLLTCSGMAQVQTNVDYKLFHMGGETSVRSGLALSPDGNTVACAGAQGFPLFLYDWRNDKILKKFDVGNWYAGAKVEYSAKGTYLLLQQTFYIDWAPNKDREVDFEIVNAESGEIVQKINAAHSVAIAYDESFYVVLQGDDVSFYELPSGRMMRKFTVENATNAVAISPDGKQVAVSHMPTAQLLQDVPSIRLDKKAIKPALKYRQMISIYDAGSMELIKTINEIYDIIYRLQYSHDGYRLFSYSIPHTKMQTSTAGRQGYIYMIRMPEGDVLRTSFMSLAPYEPDFTENNEKTLFGVVSFDVAPQINLYDFEKGKLENRFDTRQRLRDAINNKMAGDSRASFAFLPDDSIIIVTGNQTIIWKPE
ncbi:MAG: hypothetical protein H6585_15360 [Flavobacteriales bacterium]|nr:hypothetical protein [Flavobacteriales bacterium]MCB9449709.1 hypothetical protein [Flavobacteriales bacterium]